MLSGKIRIEFAGQEGTMEFACELEHVDRATDAACVTLKDWCYQIVNGEPRDITHMREELEAMGLEVPEWARKPRTNRRTA